MGDALFQPLRDVHFVGAALDLGHEQQEEEGGLQAETDSG